MKRVRPSEGRCRAGLAEDLVTVGRFLEPVEAQMAKGVLEAAGMETFLQGENANNLMAFAFRARLQVERRDEEAARELLADLIAEEGEGVDTDEL